MKYLKSLFNHGITFYFLEGIMKRTHFKSDSHYLHSIKLSIYIKIHALPLVYQVYIIEFKIF